MGLPRFRWRPHGGSDNEPAPLSWGGTCIARNVTALPPIPRCMYQPSQSPFRVTTLVEIGRGSNGEVPVQLISAAYRASREDHVMLVLDAVSPAEVDRLLDSVVARYGHTHCGIVYARMQDESEVLTVAANASRVFAMSERFRAKLASGGIPYEDLDAAEQALAVDSGPVTPSVA